MVTNARPLEPEYVVENWGSFIVNFTTPPRNVLALGNGRAIVMFPDKFVIYNANGSPLTFDASGQMTETRSMKLFTLNNVVRGFLLCYKKVDDTCDIRKDDASLTQIMSLSTMWTMGSATDVFGDLSFFDLNGKLRVFRTDFSTINNLGNNDVSVSPINAVAACSKPAYSFTHSQRVIMSLRLAGIPPIRRWPSIHSPGLAIPCRCEILNSSMAFLKPLLVFLAVRISFIMQFSEIQSIRPYYTSATRERVKSVSSIGMMATLIAAIFTWAVNLSFTPPFSPLSPHSFLIVFT